MKGLLRKLFKSLAYVAAALVILLALAVGLFRLLLPRLPEYQDEIKAWANAAIGMQVQFADMDARWRLSGPELTFRDAELTPYEASSSLVEASEISVGVSLLRLLRDRVLVVDRIQIRDTKLTVQLSKNDGWLLQGMPLSQVIGSREMPESQSGSVVVIATDIEVEYLFPDSSASLSADLERLEIERDSMGIKVGSELELPDELGGSLDISASHRLADAEAGIWEFFIEARGLDLAGLSSVEPEKLPQFTAGVLDLSASVQRSSVGIDQATADFVLTDVIGAGIDQIPSVDAQGRIEYSRDSDGWLIAASNFVLGTVEGAWPRTSLGVQVARSGEGELRGLKLNADYVNLGDLKYFQEWMPAEQASELARFDPSGEMRNFRLNVNDMDSESPKFDLATDLSGAGLAAVEQFPGVRQFTGLLRANNSGGRLEIASDGVIVDVATHLAEPITFDDANGTIIWRRNALGTTVLSDSIQFRNADLASDSSLQITIPADGGSPDVDVQSNWSVNDVSTIGRYLPAKLIKPKLYQWLSEALVAGDAPAGSLQLTGPLDKFPFDNGEGIFRAVGHLENTTLRYHRLWPAVENMTLDVVVDGMHLYSHKNSSSNAGNSIVDARLDIPDLRQPVLAIDGLATGSLESIRDFSQQSPIANVFGGHLDRITVAGDASFKLAVSFPILDRDAYSYSARIQAASGSLAFEGFEPALTELNGVVNVTRDGVSSEALFGQFLGQPVNIELKPAGESLPDFSIVAEATGRLTDEGLFAELAPQLQNIVAGASDYKATIRFPKAGLEQPAVLRILVESELEGMAINLPRPLTKPSAESLPLSFRIEFPEPGHIDAMGSLSDKLNWSVAFLSDEAGEWDFDRGVLAVGGSYPDTPDIRGLHITGETEVVVLDDWLDLARSGEGRISVADRIRSIDMTVGHLYAVGQDVKDHRIRVQRSAEDWLVEVSGSEADGTITVPYDFDSGRPIVIEMATLALPGNEQESVVADDEVADPRNMPPLRITAEHFALGERAFGRLDAEFASTERGLESISFVMQDTSFAVEGSAGWIVENNNPLEQRTYLSASLKSTDVKETMSRLAYQPGIDSESLQVDMDIGWPGGPREDFLSGLNGTVAVNVGSGQLDDVEPGAGRVFGLMSIVALPRRLSLDFKDVFEKGFGFDTIKGTFQIDAGNAYTCDLSLEGPAADVGIVGRAGLATRDYDQAAVVSPNVGNTLPIIGAFVAGPQVAAALLVFSQIFKKPLQEAGQKYYGIEGSWDDPTIETKNVAAFAEMSGVAGCISETE